MKKELYNNLKIYSEIYKKKIENKYEKNIVNSIHFLKNKAKKLEDIYHNAQYIMVENIKINEEDFKLLDEMSKKIIKSFLEDYKKNR